MKSSSPCLLLSSKILRMFVLTEVQLIANNDFASVLSSPKSESILSLLSRAKIQPCMFPLHPKARGSHACLPPFLLFQPIYVFGNGYKLFEILWARTSKHFHHQFETSTPSSHVFVFASASESSYTLLSSRYLNCNLSPFLFVHTSPRLYFAKNEPLHPYVFPPSFRVQHNLIHPVVSSLRKAELYRSTKYCNTPVMTPLPPADHQSFRLQYIFVRLNSVLNLAWNLLLLLRVWTINHRGGLQRHHSPIFLSQVHYNRYWQPPPKTAGKQHVSASSRGSLRSV
jgi:hypothetical protein